jgi:hypothetical protein
LSFFAINYGKIYNKSVENQPTAQNSLESTLISKVDNQSSIPKNSNKQRIFLILSLSLFVIIGVVAYSLGSRKTQNQNAIQKEENSSDNLKVPLLKSKNLSTVTVGAALNFVPVAEMELGYGSQSYNFQFYGLELTEELHKKFVSYAYPYGEFPGSIPAINDSPVWLASAPSDSEMILTKKGYMCLTPFDYGPTLCADDGSSSAYTPILKGLNVRM